MKRAYPGLVESRRLTAPPPHVALLLKIVYLQLYTSSLILCPKSLHTRIERGLVVHLAPEFPRTRSIPRFTLAM